MTSIVLAVALPVFLPVLLTVLAVAGPAVAAEGDEIAANDDLAISASAQDQRGHEFFGGRLWVSAFASVAFESIDGQPEEVNFDDLGVLLRWEIVERLSFFAAFELEDVVTWVDGDGVSSFPHRPAVERIHFDVRFGTGTTVAIGKTLTPFGIWNPIRRAPLTWTVDRPLVTEVAFPFHVTGVTISNKSTIGDWNVDSDLYGQPAGELDRIGDEKSANGLLGGRVALGHLVPHGFATVGVQAAWFEDTDTDEQEYAVGLDLDLSLAGHYVTSELIFFDGEVDDYAGRFGTYVQVVSPIWRGLYSVVRGELVNVDDRHDFKSIILGLAWRAQSERWILKVNYQFSENPVDDRSDGVSVGFALLF